MAISDDTPTSTGGVTVTRWKGSPVLSSHSPRPHQNRTGPIVCSDILAITRLGGYEGLVTIESDRSRNRKSTTGSSIEFGQTVKDGNTYTLINPGPDQAAFSLDNNDNPNPCTGGGGMIAEFHGAKLFSSENQDLGNNTNDQILFDTTEFDTDDFVQPVGDTTGFIVPAGLAGFYAVGFTITFGQETEGVNSCDIYLNGSPAISYASAPNANFDDDIHLSASTILELAEGDELNMNANQTDPDGGFLKTRNHWAPMFWLFLIGQSS